MPNSQGFHTFYNVIRKLSAFTFKQGAYFIGIVRYLQFIKDECVCSPIGPFSSFQSDYMKNNPSL